MELTQILIYPFSKLETAFGEIEIPKSGICRDFLGMTQRPREGRIPAPPEVTCFDSCIGLTDPVQRPRNPSSTQVMGRGLLLLFVRIMHTGGILVADQISCNIDGAAGCDIVQVGIVLYLAT